MRNVCILGATGSIGGSTADVCARHPDRFSVTAVTANSNHRGLLELVHRFSPKLAVVTDHSAAKQLEIDIRAAGLATEVLAGQEALSVAAKLPEVDDVMAAIVGAAGLEPTIAAASAGKRVLLANKESLVMSGQLFMDTVATSGAELIPIDSEHNAIYQCLPSQGRDGVRRILLTASGGPFRSWTTDQLASVTPDQACAHPNWDMGRKISVDSATLMNKGLELIEATWLFDAPESMIDVVVHPQSIIHSMVEYLDGSVLAQMGNPDMRTPIAHAMGLPERIESGVGPLDLIATGQLDFEAADTMRFPCLQLAREAARTGGIAPTVLNAANEIAVAAFLDEKIGFQAISQVVNETLSTIDDSIAPTSVSAVLEIDHQARQVSTSLLSQMIH